MFRTLILSLLILLSACKLKQGPVLTQDKISPTLIQIEERGGFIGVFGPYTFSTAGTLYYQGDSLRALQVSEINTLKRQASLVPALPASQSSGQSISRSLKLFSPQDTLIFNWGLEEEKAPQYNAIYRRLSQLITE